MRWGPHGTLEVDDVVLATSDTPESRRAGLPFVFKPRDLLEQHLALYRSFVDANVVELGVYRGGSAMLLALVARPRKLVTVDIGPPQPDLVDFVAGRDLGDRVHLHWETDQADVEAVVDALDRAIGEEPIDLVIDDASHVYEPTRASFEALFPRLRTGGRFVIEDWRGRAAFTQALTDPVAFRHAAQTDPRAQAELARRITEAFPDPVERERLVAESGHRLPDDVAEAPSPPPLGRLAVELVAAKAAVPEVFGAIGVTDDWVSIERGAAPVDRQSFRLGDLRAGHDRLLPS